MIGHLTGELILRKPPFLMLDVSGVGYELEAPMSVFYHLPKLGDKVSLWVHMLVREDAQLLYGFSDDGTRQLFRTLLKVNGVGAKMALGILSGMDQNEFASCIQNDDAAALTKLPGIGKKTAERLVIEMRDKLKGVSAVSKSSAPSITDTPLFASLEGSLDEATSALVALGYKLADAQKMVKRVYNKEHPQSTEVLIRDALKNTLAR